MIRILVFVLLLQLGLVRPVSAQGASGFELGFYGGLQGAFPSRVFGSDPGGAGDFDFQAVWLGESLVLPPYYGVRATQWLSPTFGWGLDFSHDKVAASSATLADNGLSRLEFTHGLNVLTVNVYRRWGDGNGLSPYVGAGFGFSIPHVEFEAGGARTFEYQLGGPAVALIAGARYPISDRWSVFGEFKGTYSRNALRLESGGTLNTNIVTKAVNLGVIFGF